MDAGVTLLPAREDPICTLTPREREIVGLMARGWSNARIREDLLLSAKTLESHVRSIFLKLGLSPDEGRAHRRVTAVLMYLASAESRHFRRLVA